MSMTFFALFITHYSPPMSAIQEIEQLERRRFDAQVAKDLPTLEAIFADDLIYTHSNGHQDDKASYLASIASGQSRYDKVDIEHIVVRPYNDDRTAIVNAASSTWWSILKTRQKAGSSCFGTLKSRLARRPATACPATSVAGHAVGSS